MENPKPNIDRKKGRIIGIPFKINMDINIDGKSTLVPLTSSLLYYPEENPVTPAKGGAPTEEGSYPLMPPKGILYPLENLKTLNFTELINVLFNQDRFQEKFSKWITPESLGISESKENDDSPFGTEQQQKWIQIEKDNIQILLHLLFPTFNFGSEGYKTSMHYWNPNEPTISHEYSDRKYSYLKYNGKIYTVTNAVWMNDIFNLPDYKKLIDEFRNYEHWTEEIQPALNKNIIRLQKDFTEQPNDKILEKYIKTFKRLKELTEIETDAELSMVTKKLILDEYTLKDYTAKGKKFIESLYQFSKISYSNTLLNEFLDMKNTYSYAGSRTGESKKKILSNHQLSYKILFNAYEMIEYNGDYRDLLLELPVLKGKNANFAYTNYYYIGFYNTKNTPGEPITMNLMVDVIEGQVDSQNFSKIKCNYRNEWIGKMMGFFMMNKPKWNASFKRIYFPASSLAENNNEKTAKIIDNNNKQSSDVPLMISDTGSSSSSSSSSSSNFNPFQMFSSSSSSAESLNEFFYRDLLKSDPNGLIEKELKHLNEEMSTVNQLNPIGWTPLSSDDAGKIVQKFINGDLSKNLKEYSKKTGKSLKGWEGSENIETELKTTLDKMKKVWSYKDSLGDKVKLSEWDRMITELEVIGSKTDVWIKRLESLWTNDKKSDKKNEIYKYSVEYSNAQLLIFYRFLNKTMLDILESFKKKGGSLHTKNKTMRMARKKIELSNKTMRHYSQA